MVGLLALAGCAPADRDAALQRAGDALAQARTLGENASQTSLTAARRRLAELQTHVPDAAEMERIRAQIARLDAIDRLHALEAELRETDRLRSDLARRGTEAKGRLEEAKAAYSAAQKRILAARDAIKGATERLDASLGQ